MLRSFRSFLGQKSAPSQEAPEATPAETGRPAPEHQTYIVGDLHGRADLLELMLELIDAHIGGSGSADPKLVFLGDYIDHGPASATVLARMMELTRDFPENVTCLMGCHERMLLDFLANPALRGPRWLRNGGNTTLQSFGLRGPETETGLPPDIYTGLAQALTKAMGPAAKTWLEQRPLSWSSGNLWAVHAGADPQRDMTEQSARVLLWGHPEFDNTRRGDRAWVAHGHIECAEPSLRDGRISLDTAAWSTGRLTACAVRPDGQHDFLQT